jgi:hypothetical protein
LSKKNKLSKKKGTAIEFGITLRIFWHGRFPFPIRRELDVGGGGLLRLPVAEGALRGFHDAGWQAHVDEGRPHSRVSRLDLLRPSIPAASIGGGLVATPVPGVRMVYMDHASCHQLVVAPVPGS